MSSRRIVALTTVFVITAMALSACGGDPAAKEAKGLEQTAATKIDAGDMSGAVAAYTQAIAANPASDTAYEGRGNTYVSLQQYDLGIADLTKAIDLAPERGGPYYGRGIAYRLQGNLDAAIADFSHAIGDRTKTRWRAALYERGLAYMEKGDLVNARADFERIIALEKERPGEADASWAVKAQEELDRLGP